MAHCDFGKFPNVFEGQFNVIASFDFKSFLVELHLIVCLYYDFLIGLFSLFFSVSAVSVCAEIVAGESMRAAAKSVGVVFS
jgi:hypothetical protein